jgi:hypothetical protein
MGRASAEKIAGRTPERWAENFEQIVSDMINNNTDNALGKC